MRSPGKPRRRRSVFTTGRLLIGFALGIAIAQTAYWVSTSGHTVPIPLSNPTHSKLRPRQSIDTSGFAALAAERWPAESSLQQISDHWKKVSGQILQDLDRQLGTVGNRWDAKTTLLITKASMFMSLGKPEKAYSVLQEARSYVEHEGGNARDSTLATLIYFQAVAGLRRGENDNCIMCRGESSCILPISPAAVHQNPAGSTLAVQHFTEYLQTFPNDLEAQWLLNVAHMTLGQYPDKVDSQFLIRLDQYKNSEVEIGKFRDVGHLVGVNRFNRGGGAIMEDFDNDGRLDLVATSIDPSQPIGLYRNTGDGHFEECAEAAGIVDQLGGLTCVQADYNNDGLMDIFIPRGAWWPSPVRATLLRNDGNWHFTDVTAEAGMLEPVNSNAAQWADYDNDGWLDLFVCCERQPHRLYRNQGNGTFEEVGLQSGVGADRPAFGKGCAWIDYDNDDFPDLFVNHLDGKGQLFHNDRNGTFSNVTYKLGIDGPARGFSCWAWDYNNDGWLDIFATCYELSLKGVVQGLVGMPHGQRSNKLFLNDKGRKFTDVTKQAGLDLVFEAMGSNFGDFDNDGFLDMYLGTGDPNMSTLVPNRMFKNMNGTRFAEITGSAGVGHLQKGHGIACGDWDRDGDLDIFVQMGGAVDGDKYHNILFQNPGQGHHWLTVKLVGQQTNRAAIGARIKVVTTGINQLTVYRHVSSGSSFGANPLEQVIGVGDAEQIAELEIHWPTSGTTQVFHDIAIDTTIEITEFGEEYKSKLMQRISLPN